MPVKGRKNTQEYLACELYKQIEKDLQEQLIRMGANSPYSIDLVHDYMEFWVTKCLLEDDVRRRGVMVTYNNGGGQKGKKKNDSVELKIKVTQQMTAILDKLNIKTIQAVPPENAGNDTKDGADDGGP